MAAVDAEEEVPGEVAVVDRGRGRVVEDDQVGRGPGVQRAERAPEQLGGEPVAAGQDAPRRPASCSFRNPTRASASTSPSIPSVPRAARRKAWVGA